MPTLVSALHWLTTGATGTTNTSPAAPLILSDEELRARGLDRDRATRCLIAGAAAR